MSTLFGCIVPGAISVVYYNRKNHEDNYDYDDVGPGEYGRGAVQLLYVCTYAFLGAVAGLVASLVFVLV